MPTFKKSKNIKGVFNDEDIFNAVKDIINHGLVAIGQSSKPH